MRHLSFALKLFLLIAIFFWIFRSVSLQDTFLALQKTKLSYFFLAFILNTLSSIFLTIKWQRLASPLKIRSKFSELLKLNYIATFYSSFLPGQSSGELIKGIKLVKSEESHEKVWIPIFIDKITNVLIVFIIGFFALLADPNFKENTNLVFLVSLPTILLMFLTIALFSENTQKFTYFLRDIIVRILSLLKTNTNLIKKFSLNYFEEYKKHNLLMLETILWSFLIKLPHVLAFYLLAQSLNINLNIIQAAWYFSIISIAVIVPISFSGLGIREGTSIIVLSKVGIENSSALSLSLLVFLSGILAALIGGILELFYGHKPVKTK